MILRSFSRPTAVVLALGLTAAIAACGDDSETTSAGPPSEELTTACVDYFTRYNEIAVANGCTVAADPAERCEQLHPDDTCQSEATAEYECLVAAITAEDCQCEAEGGYPLCNSAVSACSEEGDASLECFNQGG